jgi:hypothetical protein
MSTREIAEELVTAYFKAGAPADFARATSHTLVKAVDTALTKAIADERAACARAAKNAKLPKGFQRGHDAMEQFNFGKERAALAIEKRK